MSSPDKVGELKKQGGSFKAYKKRTFILQDGVLSYYRNAKDAKPAGMIPLSGCHVAPEPDQKKHPFGFQLMGPFPRVYHFLADSEPDMRSWMDAITSSAQRLDSSSHGSNLAASSSSGNVSSDDDPAFDMNPAGAKKVSLKDFDILKVIGRGSFGKVMMVRHTETKKIYAMKSLKKDLIVRENMVSHTKSEKEILQKMHHPFIVQLCFAFQTSDKLYLILEYLSGGELFYHLKQQGRFDESRAKLYTGEIALALDHLHKHDIVYRDLKPENIVLDVEGHVCLTDFGLAKMSMSNQQTYTFCGTPEYLAPEILTGQGHGKAVDWWSLGVLLYEMLTGLPPFYSENVNEMYNLILRADLRFPDYMSSSARSLLEHLLERDDKKRYGAGVNDFDKYIKPHPFFADLNWDEVYARRIKPPFVPSADEVETAAHFDPEFTSEAARDSIAVNLTREENQSFAGFSFTNESVIEKAKK